MASGSPVALYTEGELHGATRGRGAGNTASRLCHQAALGERLGTEFGSDPALSQNIMDATVRQNVKDATCSLLSCVCVCESLFVTTLGSNGDLRSSIGGTTLEGKLHTTFNLIRPRRTLRWRDMEMRPARTLGD